MITYCKKLNHQRNQAKKMKKIKKKELKRTSKIFTIWKDNSSFQTKHILPLLLTNKIKLMIQMLRTFL
jgi:hypothetical protein